MYCCGLGLEIIYLTGLYIIYIPIYFHWVTNWQSSFKYLKIYYYYIYEIYFLNILSIKTLRINFFGEKNQLHLRIQTHMNGVPVNFYTYFNHIKLKRCQMNLLDLLLFQQIDHLSLFFLMYENYVSNLEFKQICILATF